MAGILEVTGTKQGIKILIKNIVGGRIGIKPVIDVNSSLTVLFIHIHPCSHQRIFLCYDRNAESANDDDGENDPTGNTHYCNLWINPWMLARPANYLGFLYRRILSR